MRLLKTPSTIVPTLDQSFFEKYGKQYWNNFEPYLTNDIVLYNNAYYRAKNNNQYSKPPSSDWERVYLETINQDLSSTSSPTFNSVTVTEEVLIEGSPATTQRQTIANAFIFG